VVRSGFIATYRSDAPKCRSLAETDQSCEVIANEEEAAIAFSGKVSRNDLLPLVGAVTRIAGGGDACGPAPIAGVTLRGMGCLGAPVIGPTALGEFAGLGLVGGGVLRATSPVAPLRPGLTSGLADGLDSIVGDELEAVEGTFAKDLESQVLSLDFSAEGGASSSLLAPEESTESMWDRLVTAEDGPVGLGRVAESTGRPSRDD